MRVLIVGGAGAFGSFYAKLFSQNGFKVGILDTDAEAGRVVCKENGFEWVEKNASLKKFDIAVVCVPNPVAPSVVRELGPLLAQGCLLMDFCSVKTAVVKELKKLSKLGIELASIHPMHGPRVKSIAGYPVGCMPIKSGKLLKAMQEFFTKNGADFFFSTAKEHDKFLSIVQGLTHYSQFISAAVLRELGINLKDSMRFGSPNYHLFLSLMSRVILQNPEMYTQIQLSNPYNKEVWNAFKKKAEEFDKLCRNGNHSMLKKKIIDCAQEFKGEDSFLWESDRAVNAINHFVETIRRRIGKRFMVENIQTGKMHYGKIDTLEGQYLVMDEHGRKTRISLNHLRLTTKQEMRQWRMQNLKQAQLDYSFLAPKECSKETIRECLSHIKAHTLKILDEYESDKLPEGKKSITIRVSFFEDDDAEKIDKKVRETVKGLGFSFR